MSTLSELLSAMDAAGIRFRFGPEPGSDHWTAMIGSSQHWMAMHGMLNGQADVEAWLRGQCAAYFAGTTLPE